MNQEKIWEAYQNDDDLLDVGFPAQKRFEFLAKKVLSGKRVLNIGVGKGYLEKLLIDKEVDVYCLDPSRQTIDSISKRLNLGDKAKTGYSQDIPFPESFFDYVIMSEVLEHLSDRILEATLREVKRILVPGGEFLGTVPADENLKLSIVVCPDCGKRFHRWGHEQAFTKDRLEQLLSNLFYQVTVQRKYFFEWGKTNWKGKCVGLYKWIQAALDIKGASQNFFFEAIKK